MDDDAIWAELGLDRTNDVREIRRAYSRRLKVIDTEEDAAAFIRLRAARDRAFAVVAEALPDTADAHPSATGLRPVEIVREQMTATADNRRDRPDAGQDVPALPPLDPALFERLEALLLAPDASPAAEAVIDATQRILADPALERIASARAAEARLADLIVRAAPRSDPIIEIVSAYFGWDGQTDDISRPRIVDWIRRRREDAAFRSRLLNDSRSHWLILAGVVFMPFLFVWFLLRRGYHPLTRLLGFAWLGLILAAGVANYRPKHEPLAYSWPGADIDRVLQDIAEPTDLDQLARMDPALHARLSAEWTQARDTRLDRPTFDARIRAIIEKRVAAGVRGGDDAVQSEYWALIADKARILGAKQPQYCDAVFRGETPSLEGLDYWRTQNRILAGKILGSPLEVSPPPRARRLQVPAEIRREALRQSGLSPLQLDEALAGRATAGDRCSARLALIYAALAAPADIATPVLRDWSAAVEAGFYSVEGDARRD